MKISKMRKDLRRLHSKEVNIELCRAHWLNDSDEHKAVNTLWSKYCLKKGK